MKRVSTAALVPGMVTAEEVFNYKGNLILPKGHTLTKESIDKLEFYSVINVRVETEDDGKPEDAAAPPAQAAAPGPGPEAAKEPASQPTPQPVPQPAPMEKDSYAERLRKTEEFQQFENGFQQETVSFKESINEVIENIEDLDADTLVKHALSLLSTEGKHVNVFDMLHNMRQMDDSTYVHCMNVGLICNIFAHWLKMSEEDARTATVCGLLHDIGKLKMPESIIKKPGRLTDEEFNIIRTHPREGYNLLMQAPVDDHVRNAALMHHERCDGSGYPLKLSLRQIDPFAKIVAIADVYDAMTSARVYRGPQCPFKVIAAFEDEGLQKYDPAYILTFLENIVNTYILHRVRLSNGEEGDVVYINHNKLSKPTVRVGNRYIDLAHEPHLTIDSLV